MNKSKFLDWELQSLTISAGIGRGNPVYKKGIDEAAKKRLRKTIREKLHEYAEPYKQSISEKEHVKNIRSFANDVTNAHSETLANGKFIFGRAQKLLNLYLKYLWVIGPLNEPLHCPIDSIVMAKLGNGFNSKRWTFMDSEEEYMEVIDKVRENAKSEGLSIAYWELKLWNEMVQKV